MQASTLKYWALAKATGLALTMGLTGSMGMVSVLSQPAAAQSWSVWQSLQVKDGHFTILMPGESDRTRQSLKVLGESTEQTILSAAQWQHDARYSVSWTDLPESLNLEDERQRAYIFEEMLSHLSQDLGGQLTKEGDLVLAGHPGKQYQLRSWSDGETYQITSRAFMIGQRFFQISVAMPERVTAGLNGSTKGFLKSFQLR